MSLFFVSQLYITSHSVALPNYLAIARKFYNDNKRKTRSVAAELRCAWCKTIIRAGVLR